MAGGIAARAARAMGLARSSAILRLRKGFDAGWYSALAGAELTRAAAMRDYLTAGRRLGRTPHPLFDPATYRAAGGPERLLLEAYAGYLAVRSRRRLPTHPLFDVERYLAAQPAAVAFPGGPIEHYLRYAEPDLRARLVAHGTDWGRRRGYAAATRLTTRFDAAAAARFVASYDGIVPSAGDFAVTVTVVMPVWNRAADVGRAIDSVCEQTLRDWELVVVDDGSTDDLAAVEARYADDPRISVVHRPHEGVGAARNAGLARARGRYVAWLDSDDTWTPEHLRVLIAFMQREGHRAAYDVLELRRPGHPPGYRTLAGGRDHLVNGNHIGQTVLVHERALVDEIGGYDETLPRTVDFDFILRMSAVTGFGFAPFVGCVVNHDPADVSRITRSHPATWIDVVLNRNTLDWAGAATTSRDAAGCTLVVLPYGGPAVVADSVRRLVASLDGTAARILLVDNGFDLATSQVVAAQAWRYDGVDVVAAPSDRGWAVALNLGALAARTETVVLVDPAVLPEPGWLPPLLTALDDDGVIGAQPGSGDADGDVTSLVWGVCALRVADLVAVRGLDPLMRPAFAMADLSARLRAERPGAFRAVPASVVRRPPAGLRPMSRHTELDAEAADAEGRALYEARWGPPSG